MGLYADESEATREWVFVGLVARVMWLWFASLVQSREKLLMVSIGEWRGERPARKSAKSGVPKITITKSATLVSKIIPSDSMSDRLELDQIYTCDHLTFHST
jgi:hypothetical protein